MELLWSLQARGPVRLVGEDSGLNLEGRPSQQGLLLSKTRTLTYVRCVAQSPVCPETQVQSHRTQRKQFWPLGQVTWVPSLAFFTDRQRALRRPSEATEAERLSVREGVQSGFRD